MGAIATAAAASDNIVAPIRARVNMLVLVINSLPNFPTDRSVNLRRLQPPFAPRMPLRSHARPAGYCLDTPENAAQPACLDTSIVPIGHPSGAAAAVTAQTRAP